MAPVHAQVRPDAGTLLEAIRRSPELAPPRGVPTLPAEPATPLPAGNPAIRFDVSRIVVEGAQAFPAAELEAMVADAVGAGRSLADLQEGANRITQHYRAAGYLLARAFLPAQDVVGGLVRIAVAEGRLGKVSLDNAGGVPEQLLHSRLSGVSEGSALRAQPLERSLLLLSDLPGVEVRSTLKPGSAVGTADLDVRVALAPRFAASVDADNLGDPHTGTARLGASLAAHHLAGQADTLSLRLQAAGRMQYARLGWHLPVREASQLGLSLAGMQYRLGKSYSVLEAHGDARVASVHLQHAWVRSRDANLNGLLQLEHRRLRDAMDAVGTSAEKVLRNATISLSGDGLDTDASRYWSWSLSGVLGQLRLSGPARLADSAAYRTQGVYRKFGWQAQYLQELSPGLSLQAGGQGQLAGNNLDSNEKMALGGLQGVRAYAQGEASCDHAAALGLELRQSLGAQWRVSGFVDAGWGRIHRDPLPTDTDNSRHLAGAGMGLAWSDAASKVQVQTTVAWKTAGQGLAGDKRQPRVMLQVGVRL